MSIGKKTGGRPFPKGNPGKPKGAVSRVTKEIKARARSLLEDREYLVALQRRLIKGTAGPVEVVLFHYGYGKPKESLDVKHVSERPLIIDLVTDRAQLRPVDPDASDDDGDDA